MKSKPTLITGFAFLLLSGILAYFIFKGHAPASDPLAGNAGSPRLWTSHKDNTSSTRSSRPRTRDAETATHLVEQFGVSRTRYARKITTDLVSDFGGLVELIGIVNQWTYIKNNNPEDDDERAKLNPANEWNEEIAKANRDLVDMFALPYNLDLTDAQRKLAFPIISSLVQSRYDAMPQIINEMRTRPEQFMELFLYGDARARGIITEEEYQAATARTRAMYETVIYSLYGRRRESDFHALAGEEAFLSELSAVINPEQQAKLAEMSKVKYVGRQREAWGPAIEHYGGTPVVELDLLSKMVSTDHSYNVDRKQKYQRWIQEASQKKE